MSYQSSKHLFIIPIISIMSISYKTIGNNFKWPFIAAKWSEFLHFFRDFKYLYHFESLNAVLYLSVHNWTEFLVDFNMGESLGLGKKSSGPETDTETWSWFRLLIPKPGFGRTLLQGIRVLWRLQLNWDSQLGRLRTTSVLVRAFWNFKRKVLKYSRNCSLHNTLDTKLGETPHKDATLAVLFLWEVIT